MKWRLVVAQFLTIFGIFVLSNTSLITDPVYAKGKHHSSGLSSSRHATGRYVFIFDYGSMRWAAYNAHGELIRSGHAVGGRDYCPDVRRGCRTPMGTFHLYQKVGPNFVSSKYPLPNGGAHMPWGMFFHKGYAIHGSNDVPNHHASHGCIRVIPSEARWLNHTLPIGTTVIVR